MTLGYAFAAQIRFKWRGFAASFCRMNGYDLGAVNHPARGFQRGEATLRRVIQQGRERPAQRKNPKKPEVSWHTTLLAKSRVLYLLRTLTLERGGCASCLPFLTAAEQAECGYPRSACSYGGDAEKLHRRVRKRDIQPAEATFPDWNNTKRVKTKYSISEVCLMVCASL